MEFSQLRDEMTDEKLNQGYQRLSAGTQESLHAVVAWITSEKAHVERFGSTFLASTYFIHQPTQLLDSMGQLLAERRLDSE